MRTHTYLNFAGEAKEAFEFYRSIFGGEFSSAVSFKETPMEGVDIPIEDGDKMMHIALPIGEDSVLMAKSSSSISDSRSGAPGSQTYLRFTPSDL